MKGEVPALEKLLALREETLEEMSEAEKPSEDSATLDKYFSICQEVLQSGKDMVQAIKDKNEAHIHEIGPKGDALKAEESKAAQDYGFKICSQKSK